MAEDNSAFVLQPLTSESAFSEPALSPISSEQATGEGKQGFPGFNEAAAVGTIVKSKLTTMSNVLGGQSSLLSFSFFHSLCFTFLLCCIALPLFFVTATDGEALFIAIILIHHFNRSVCVIGTI